MAHSTARGAGAVVLDRDADAHRLLARQLLRDFRGQPGDAPDEKHESSEGRREAHVVQHGRQRAVDVDRQRLHRCGDGLLHRAGRTRCRRRRSPLRCGQVEEERGASDRSCARDVRSRAGVCLPPAPVRRSACAASSIVRSLGCRERDAFGNLLHAAEARRRRDRRRRPASRPRPRPRSTAGCRTRPAAPSRTTGRRSRDRRHRSGSRRAALARPATAAVPGGAGRWCR